jgi:nicotinate-nucleotide adenylyltransferase
MAYLPREKGRSSVRFGIFGGTFNPPHIGHLILAETAVDTLGLDRVFFVPAADPPHKVGVPRASVEHRVNMVQLAIQGNQSFELSRMDIDRPGPHYAADMVALFKAQYPDDEFYFLMGSDSLRDLLSWERPGQLVEQCYIVVMSRPVLPPDMDMLYADLPQLRDALISISSPEVDISSTNLVIRMRNGQSVRYRLPETVREYINEHNLYQD